MVNSSNKFKLALVSFLFSFSLYGQTGSTPTGSDTSCANGISLYQRNYGGIKDEFGYSVAGTVDSGYVIAGQTNSFGGGGYDGLLMKFSKKGAVIWSRAIGGSGNDLFYGVRRTSDNGFIAVGQTRSYGNTAGDAWLVKVDASGSVQWSKKYGDGNVNGEIAYDVVELSGGGYAFCGSHRFAPGSAEGFVVRTDNQGNVLWAKQYGISGSDQLSGIVEDGNSLVVVGFYQGGSFYDGYIMKLDKANGAMQWVKGYDGESRSSWSGRIIKTNTGYQVYGILTDDYGDTNVQEVVWNMDANGNLQNVRKLVIPGIKTLSTGWYGLPDGGFVAVNSANTSSSDLIFCKVNSNGSLGWAKKFVRNGVQQIAAIVAAPEGGYAATGYNNNAGTAADSNNVYLVRVDSLGEAGPCSGTNTNELSIVAISATSPTPPIGDLGTVTINNPVITVGVVSFTPVTNTHCYYCQLIMPPVPSDTTCSNGTSLYQRNYGGTKDEFGYGIAMASDSGYVVVGQTRSYGSGASDGLLLKVNKKGLVMWSRAVGGSGDDVFYGVTSTSDNGFIAVGQTKSYGNTAGDAWLVKVDASGNIQWTKKYGDGNINGEIGYNIVELSGGGYAFCGSHRFAPGSAEGFVVRTDNQGNVLWAKQYGSSGSDQLSGIVEDGNSLVVAGFYQGGSFYDSYIMKLDKSNGSVQWMKGYDGESRSTWFSRISKTNTGYQVFGLITDDFTDNNQQESVWNFDLNGNLQNARKLVIPGVKTLSYGWYTLPDGGFVAVNGGNTTNSDLIFCKVNSNGNLAWSKKFLKNGRQQIGAITGSLEVGYAAVGYNNNAGITADSNNVYLMRVDSLGGAGTCSGTTTNELTVVTLSTASQTPPITDLGTVTINNPVITAGLVNFAPANNIQCFYCLPKPTGTARNPDSGGRSIHQLKIYPNPVPGGNVNLTIDALYSDRAVISLVDLRGNLIAAFGEKEISIGKNNIELHLPRQVQAYSSYFVLIKFREFSSSVKIFVVR